MEKQMKNKEDELKELRTSIPGTKNVNLGSAPKGTRRTNTAIRANNYTRNKATNKSKQNGFFDTSP